MFPSQAITVIEDIHSGTFGTFLATTTTPRTILSASSFCSQQKDNTLTIGYLSPLANNNNLVDTEGANGGIQLFLNKEWPINTAIYWNKELSGDKCHYTLTYIENSNYSTSTATSTGISTINGFSYGEALIVFVLLLIFTNSFFSELKKWIFGVRIENPMRNKYNKDL